MNLVRKQKMSVDPINVYLFSTVLSYHFKSSRKSHFFNRESDQFGQKVKNAVLVVPSTHVHKYKTLIYKH